ncbi:UDP-N-acetylmuramoyl-L-alanine--D-glutamate ligase [Thalassomonas sp. M1454]|uniref:UDP-N-acetylmuramoyl-L-alanine--D-glutamate ligase n=1 Tax=Thalassomonas sp. M1454 TaxID=2594477 RepID=UPI001180A43B|nr:UDP-N-acetylmuramoyl-L-alanine--D-glutamate ligase [Thalassomonas sp. M1454]TRX52720.1 UDP-N-acetylmuramoyl-L-alanine--D-glutamate ligase [Thalassomonas sp. M1454]
MQTLTFLQDKQILVLGLGATGLSCAKFLAAQGLQFVINDSRARPPGVKRLAKLNSKSNLIIGHWDIQAIANADIIIASPGVDINLPVIADNRKAQSKLIGDVELFFLARKYLANDDTLIAVTGSNGKSTVVSLLAHIAKGLNFKTALAGNIGLPVLDIIDSKYDAVVLELSSFQLETMQSMQAQAATVLNICDDHLDRHKTLENYQTIKHKIYDQTHVQVINREQASSQPSTVKDNAISFGLDAPQQGHFGIVTNNGIRSLAFGEQALIACSNLPLVGRHNELNCLAVLALGYAAGWPLADMCKALLSFEGLEHRCKQVESNDGVIWVNDSKATNIGATIAAIDGLANDKQQLILIAGGDGKGADFNELKPALTAHVDKLITLGKDGDQIANLKPASIRTDSIESAVAQARKLANKGDVVLLSPACASIDMFENYMQRGEVFITAVREAN